MIKKLISVLLIMFLLTGCKTTEVTQRVFVRSIYADKSEGNFYLEILYDTGNGEEKIFSSKGKDFETALISAEKILGKDVFTEHCKIIFVGAGIKDIESELQYIPKSRVFSYETIICRCGYKNVLKAENLSSFSEIKKKKKGGTFGTLFYLFSGKDEEYPIATLENGFIILL